MLGPAWQLVVIVIVDSGNDASAAAYRAALLKRGQGGYETLEN